jgi:UDPglucose 6-dehydrogenase
MMLGYLERALGDLNDKTIAIWGLAFKPGTDDVREAPALRLIESLVERGAQIRATDPKAMETATPSLARLGKQVTLLTGAYEASQGADALVVATEWPEYRNPDLQRVAKLMRGRHVFDGRNVLSPEAATDAGLIYRGMGRPEFRPANMQNP